MEAPSVKELMATFIARDIADGEEVFVGTNLPVIRAGALLAHLHHGPSMRVMVAHTRTNFYHTPVMEHFELLADWRGARWAEGYFNDNEIVMYQKSRRDSVFFVGALREHPWAEVASDVDAEHEDQERVDLHVEAGPEGGRGAGASCHLPIDPVERQRHRCHGDDGPAGDGRDEREDDQQAHHERRAAPV